MNAGQFPVSLDRAALQPFRLACADPQVGCNGDRDAIAVMGMPALPHFLLGLIGVGLRLFLAGELLAAALPGLVAIIDKPSLFQRAVRGCPLALTNCHRIAPP
jgi:hypothetical protein